MQWFARAGARHITDRIETEECSRAFPIDVPKENFGTRPATILHPLDRFTYQSVVDFLSVRLAGHLPDFVCGWRLRRDDPKPGVYSGNAFEWKNHREHLHEFAQRYEFALTTDVVSFFGSIDSDRLCEVVEGAARRSRARTRLLAYLKGFEAACDRRGIPQRSFASALLANAFLKPLDELLLARSSPVLRKRRRSTHSVVRWMDDIWLFGDDEGDLRLAQLELESAMRQLGLNMNTAKTTILSNGDLEDAARQRQHSGVEAQLTKTAGDETSELEELVAHLVGKPEGTSRSTYRFVMGQVEEFGLEEIARQVIPIAHRAPHAADSLADAFRRLGLWRELGDWYLWYRQSSWVQALSHAHFGRMFPRDEPALTAELADIFEEDSASKDMSVSTVAFSRLVAWDDGRARQCLREAATGAEHPLLRRNLALTALDAREERAFVRRLLRAHAENAPLLELVEERHFEPFKMWAGF